MIASLLLWAASQAAAPMAIPLPGYRWYPSSATPWKTAIGVAGPRSARRIAMLQIGVPGHNPRQLTSFAVDCGSGRIGAVDFMTVDPTFRRATPMAGAAFAALADIAASGSARTRIADFDGIIREVLQFGCDDARLAETHHIPLSKVSDDASYPDRQG